MDVQTDESIFSFCDQRFSNFAEDLDQVSPCAAARIEYIDALVRKPICNVEFSSQSRIHAFDHVTNDLPRRVPNTHCLAQFGIESPKERFIEVLNRIIGVKGAKEGIAVDTVQRFTGAIKDAHEAER